MQAHRAGADKPNYSEAVKKICVSFNRICLNVTLQGLDHVASCHSKFSNQFSETEIHGGLGGEPRQSTSDYHNQHYLILR